MSYQIDSGVPRLNERANTITATLKKMEVGQSIVIPKEKRGGAASVARHLGLKITTRTVSDTEVRLWRTA
jgi:hypothetical protein